MKYEQLELISKADANTLLKSPNLDQVAKTLVSLSHIQDVAYVEEKYLEFLSHPDEVCAGAAVVGISHMARIHRTMDGERVRKKLEQLAQERPNLQERVRDTLEDMEIYL